MNILDVVKRTVKAFPGSYEGIGAAIGMSPHVLRNKLSKANSYHQLTLLEFIDIMEQAVDAGVPDAIAGARALAHDFGHQLVVEGQAGAGDMSMAQSLIEVTRHASELCMAAVHAIDDGIVDDSERQGLAERRLAATRAIAELEQAVLAFGEPAATRAPVRLRSA
jgi:hypothetical protein